MRLWADGGARNPFHPRPGGEARGRAAERLKAWTRERFGLADGETIVVTEGVPTLPGYPEVETLVTFPGSDGMPRHFKVFKPAPDVTPEDIPPRWMKDALGGIPGVSCSCC